MWHGSSVGNTDFKTFFLFPIHCLRFVSTKSNGGLNSKPDYAAKKIWNISAKPIKRSSHFTICICSKKQRQLLQLRLQKRKERILVLLLPQRQKAYHKRKRFSWHSSKMIQKCDTQFYKRFFKIIQMMTPPAQQHINTTKT